MQEITVRSSNGVLSVDALTGNVISCTMEEDGDEAILNIRKFDLKEWFDFYTDEELPDSIDILNLGYWYVGDITMLGNGYITQYEPPVEEWRLMMANS